jgi:polar amino acid transport system permease protein
MSLQQMIERLFSGPNFAQALHLFLTRLPGALLTTCIVTAGAVVVAVGTGVILALLRASRSRSIAMPAAALIYIGRCIPLPPLQFLIYFSLLSAFRLDSIYAGMLAVGLYYVAPMGELFRSGIGSVPPGQIEAAFALGMDGGRVRRRIVIPIALRIMLPAIGQLVVGILISSSFVSQIGAKDLTGMARNIINDLFTPELWLVVAFVYFAIAFPLSRVLSWLERRMAVAT